jgi:hypothetical protein
VAVGFKTIRKSIGKFHKPFRNPCQGSLRGIFFPFPVT